MVIPPLEHVKPMSIAHTLAEHFHRDSVDFAQRFDLLWEAGPLMHKLGRIKSFIDLLMACECALKAHGFLGRLNEDPREIYRKRSTNPILPRARYAVINCSALRFQGRRASKCSTVVAAGKARSTWRSHRYGSKPLALADEGTDGILGRVVVDRQIAALEVPDQARPLPMQVAQRTAEHRGGRHGGERLVEPAAQFVDDGAAAGLA
ncbi:MAG: hypothetical protein PWP40_1421 [Rhodocyclaceae bacterium]|nr:hypothetical protein [Rhodocyclaceae bacterium]